MYDCADGSSMYVLCSTALTEGEFVVDYISFTDPHDNSSLSEFDYPGPQFATLDESVQEGIMMYLEERYHKAQEMPSLLYWLQTVKWFVCDCRGVDEYLLAYMNLKMEEKENELYMMWLRKLHKQLS